MLLLFINFFYFKIVVNEALIKTNDKDKSYIDKCKVSM